MKNLWVDYVMSFACLILDDPVWSSLSLKTLLAMSHHVSFQPVIFHCFDIEHTHAYTSLHLQIPAFLSLPHVMSILILRGRGSMISSKTFCTFGDGSRNVLLHVIPAFEYDTDSIHAKCTQLLSHNYHGHVHFNLPKHEINVPSPNAIPRRIWLVLPSCANAAPVTYHQK
jgi:hypothetical protein